jgi:copper chaperone CopZ
VVQEALSGLPGVKSIKVDLDRNLLRIRYDPEKVTPEKMLAAIAREEFEGKIVPEER